MYDSKTKTLIDRRELLKIKANSLIAETAIIRKAEAKQKAFGRRAKLEQPFLLNEMVNHRKMVVRLQSRLTGLALGFIRGTDLSKMEPYPTHLLGEGDWGAIRKMIVQYGNNNALAFFDAQKAQYANKQYGTKPVVQRKPKTEAPLIPIKA